MPTVVIAQASAVGMRRSVLVRCLVRWTQHGAETTRGNAVGRATEEQARQLSSGFTSGNTRSRNRGQNSPTAVLIRHSGNCLQDACSNPPKYKASCGAQCPLVYSNGILFLPEGFFFTHFLALHRCQRNACAAGRRRFCWPKASRLRFARGRTLPVHA